MSPPILVFNPRRAFDNECALIYQMSVLITESITKSLLSLIMSIHPHYHLRRPFCPILSYLFGLGAW